MRPQPRTVIDRVSETTWAMLIAAQVNDMVTPYSVGVCDCCHKFGLRRHVEIFKNWEYLDNQNLCMSCRTTVWHIRPGEIMHSSDPRWYGHHQNRDVECKSQGSPRGIY